MHEEFLREPSVLRYLRSDQSQLDTQGMSWNFNLPCHPENKNKLIKKIKSHILMFYIL